MSSDQTLSKTPKLIAAVVLAGGLSSRMGDTNKLLLKLDGESLLRQCVANIIAAGVDEVVVVLGHESERTRDEVKDLGVRVVLNTNYETGQMSSVQCGLNALSGDKHAAMICLADQPLLTPSHLHALIHAFEHLPIDKHIVVPVYMEQRGNPVLLSEAVRKQVVQQGGSLGCRKYIDENPDKVHWLRVSDAAYTTDIDTPEQYQLLF